MRSEKEIKDKVYLLKENINFYRKELSRSNNLDDTNDILEVINEFELRVKDLEWVLEK